MGLAYNGPSVVDQESVFVYIIGPDAALEVLGGCVRRELDMSLHVH